MSSVMWSGGRERAPYKMLKVCILSGLVTQAGFGLLGILSAPPGRVIAGVYAVIALVAVLSVVRGVVTGGNGHTPEARTHRLLVFLIYMMVVAAGASAVVGIMAGQSLFHTALGVFRLVFVPVVVAGFSMGMYRGLAIWLLSDYVRYARVAYSVLLSGLVLNGLTGGWELLRFGAGFDPLLTMSGLGLIEGYHSRRASWFDLLVSLGLAVVSMKRGALVGVVAVLVGGIAVFGGRKVGRALKRVNEGRSGARGDVALRACAGVCVVAVGLGVPQFSARAESIVEVVSAGDLEAVPVRAEETREAFRLVRDAGAVEALVGYGAGHRFEAGREDTGALHNSYLTWLLLGGGLWGLGILGIGWLGLRSKTSYPQMKVVLGVMLMVGLKGNLSLHVTFAAVLGYCAAVRAGEGRGWRVRETRGEGLERAS